MREFQLNAAKYLKDLPIELTRYGEVVAVVYFPGEVGDLYQVKAKNVPDKMEKFQKLKNSLEAKPEDESASKTSPTPLGMKKVEEVYVDKPKTFWNGGKKWMVDENGNEKEVK